MEYLPPYRPVNVDFLMSAFSGTGLWEDHAYLFSMDMPPAKALELLAAISHPYNSESADSVSLGL